MACLILLFHIILAITKAAESQTIAKHGCPEKCGTVDIPYPFGIGPNCSFHQGFALTCNSTGSSMVPFHGNTEVLSISLTTAQARLYNQISWQCYQAESLGDKIKSDTWSFNLNNTVYRLSNQDNMFTVIGCQTLAYIKMWGTGHPYLTGCVSTCYKNESLTDGSCSGNGCCQISIPSGFISYSISFDKNFNSSQVVGFIRCSYALVMATDSFKFFTSYVSTYDFWSGHNGSLPVVLDWSIGQDTCEIAQANMSNYACVSNNSVCVNSTNGPGYFCNCSNGYQGNPYLLDGCQDINECEDKSTCSESGTCINTDGSYKCICPLGMQGDAKVGCHPEVNRQAIPAIGISIIAIGVSSASLGLLSCSLWILIRKLKVKRSKQLKEKYFKQNHGILLQRLISATEDTTGRMKIFSLEELEKATNNFDEARILGRGGHGTVYKGILSDLRVVAIKRSKIVNQSEIDQFINEVVILSQINHRNVVKHLGCCLETEVPLLVNEFISNGTLSDHLHVSEGQSLQWKDRLRIALETARAISYIHSAASLSVFHRDIKCSNVLLDDCLIAKLSDFGASRSIRIDQTGITTVIQGTYGYLDPEYYHTGRFTDKSDVYSFGVILAELLTREKANSNGTSSEGGSLTARFMTVMRENRLFEMLDSQIVEEAPREQLEEVAALAERCLRLRHEERPGIKVVEMRLEFIWGGSNRYSPQPSQPTSQILFREQISILNYSMAHGDNSRQYSLEEEVLLSNKFPR